MSEITHEMARLEDCSVPWSQEHADPHAWLGGCCPDPVNCKRVAAAEERAYQWLRTHGLAR